MSATNSFDLGSHRGTCNLFAIPDRKTIVPVYSRNGNMTSVDSGPSWNGTFIDQSPAQMSRIFRDFQFRNTFKDGQSSRGCIGISSRRFGYDKLRNKNVKFRPSNVPPFGCRIFVGHCTRIVAGAMKTIRFSV